MKDYIVNLFPNLPNEISKHIQDEFEEIQKRHNSQDLQPTEFYCARFGETILRYLEWKGTGNYTDFGSQINRQRIIGETGKKHLS